MSYKREIPVMLGTIIIVILLVNYVIEVSFLQNIENELTSWATIIASFALGQGFFNILTITYKRIKREPNVVNNLPKYTMILVVAFLTVIGLAGTANSPLYEFWYVTLQFPVHQTLNGLKIFFLASAAYRAMRVTSIDSALLVASMMVVAISATPLGEMLWPGSTAISSWILDFPGSGAERAIILTAGIGIIIFGARVLLWKERRVYGG